MSVLPFDVLPLTSAPVPTAAAGTGPASPGDFLAAFLAAMAAPAAEEAPVAAPVDPAPEPVSEAPAPPEEEAYVDPAVAVLAALAVLRTPVEVPAQADPRALVQAALSSAGVVEAAPIPTSTGTAAAPVPGAAPTTVPAAAPAPEAAAVPPAVADPVTSTSTRHTPELAVAGMAAPTKEHASVPAEAPSSLPAVPNLPATAIQPDVPTTPSPSTQPGTPPITSSAAPTAPVAPVASASAPLAHTAPLDRVAAQVFPEVTGLVSRGNGTHRITMTLNPEQLGEVRVVMTVREGAVHVRLAAGQETRAALLDGSPELSRLLESAGATETRIVVRDLPSTPAAPANPLGGAGAGAERSLDQHAGTRADHQARDGSDHHPPRSTRTDGVTSTGSSPRSTQPVIDTRTAGVDLTM